ncbi:MAG: DUF5320 domain-containing protein [Bacillota bacterium]|jgi:hypothetical protein
MPRGDGTGPAGFGPMTGRAAGYCAGYDAPGARGRAGARGQGAVGIRPRIGAGRGRGHRRMYYATGMPGWMRYGCPELPVGGFQGVPQESRYADDVQGMSAEREKELLSQQVQFLRSELGIVERRLNDLTGLGSSPEQSPDQGQGSTEGGE